MRHDFQTAPDHQEIELKFFTSDSGFKASQQWPALGAPPPRQQRQHLVTRYFDTEDADLERHRMVLRMRKQGRGHVIGVKWIGEASGPFARGEIEAASPGPEPDIDLLGPDCARMLAGIIGDKPLLPVFETDIRRLTRCVRSDSSDVEVAFDSGCIRAGERQTPIREIELELKSGDPAELYRLGMALAEAYPVRLGMQAKAERGVMLRHGAPPPVIKSISPLTGAITVDDAIGAVIDACIAQFTGNFPAFESGDAVNAVHQMRVALRRLRAILKLFNRVFPCPEFAAFRAQAKAIASALGEGRNWDVFLQLLREGPAAAFPEEPGFEPIFAAAGQRREAAYAEIGRLLAAPETTCFVLSVQAFTARHGWRNALTADALFRLTQPAAGFAAGHLNRMHGKLVKRGRHLQRLPPHDRHKLRIGLKNIRYAADLFGGLFEGDKALRALLRTASRLQDQLGAYNDLVTAIGLMEQLGCSAPAGYAAGIVAGWCRRGAEPDEESLLRAWKKFRKAKFLAL